MHSVASLFVALGLLVTLCVCQSCNMSGSWDSTRESDSSSTQTILEFDDDGHYQLQSETTWMTTNTTCSLTTTFYGTYTINDGDLLETNATMCEFSNCSPDCGLSCDDGCTVVDPLHSTEIEFSSTCESFAVDETVFTKEGSLWLVYAVAGLAIGAGLLVLVVGAAAAGFLIFRKKQSNSSHGESSYEPTFDEL